MALSTNNRVTLVDIVNNYLTGVKNVILSGAYDSSSPPSRNGIQCVPANILGAKSEFGSPTVGYANGSISASQIYNGVTSLTRQLTRVGTFSFIRRRRGNNYTLGGWDSSGRRKVTLGSEYYTQLDSFSGKCVFTSSYIRTLSTVDASGVTSGQRVSATAITNLIAECLRAWSSTSKYHYSSTHTECHDSCYSDCHSNCYSECHSDCYTNTRHHFTREELPD